MKSIITGGAGFIGSHLADALVARGDEVIVIDNLATGTADHLARHIESDSLLLLTDDLLEDGWQDAFAGAQRVYHVAADPDVRASAGAAYEVYRQNTEAAMRVLEAMRIHEVPELVFTSTSTVYGEADQLPTPESYPTTPISLYGASKLACEAFIASYCHTFDMYAWIYRFANVIGMRSTHGVIYDFINKIRSNPEELEILGDGTQTKSYIYISDCIEAMRAGLEAVDKSRVYTFNIGTTDMTSVTRIAELVCETMQASPEFKFTGGKRGWIGDVPVMLLDASKLTDLSWKQAYKSEEAVKKAINDLLSE